jgi:T5SS/PEP-CTERM-associated repeat protein
MISLKIARQRPVAAIGVFAVNLILAGIALGQTPPQKVWIGDMSSNWFGPNTSGANWSPPGIPTAGDAVIINASPNAPIIMPTGSFPVGMANANALSINLGSTATGNLTIQGGATLHTGTPTALPNVLVDYIGGNSPGTVTVTGSGSLWSNISPFPVGGIDIGSGSALGMLNIENGARVEDSVATVAAGAGAGTVTVNGMGSTWTNRNLLIVGGSGQGTLNIMNGGRVAVLNNGDVSVANNPGSSGTVTVDGPASTLMTGGRVLVGNQGTGELTISNGGMVTDGEGSAGITPASEGTVTVTDPGSTWNNSLFSIGTDGPGTLMIKNGGTVNSNLGFVGADSGSVGTVTVSGSGSTWTNTGGLTVGQFGTGTLSISNGAVVMVAGGTAVALEEGSVGTISIGAPADMAPAPPGTLNTPSVAFGAGAGTLNFNHTSTNYVFTPMISGPGKVDVLAGTTILTNNNTYAGGTNISQDTTVPTTLVVGASTALGVGNVNFSGGVLRTTSLGDPTPPLTIKVGGNYTQGPDAELQLGVAGILGRNYDHVSAAGSASVDGTLSVFSLGGFAPANRNAFAVVRGAGGRSGTFSTINDQLNLNRLQRVDIYAKNAVVLLYLTPQPPPPDHETPPPINEDAPDVVVPPVDPNEPLPEDVVVQLVNPTAEELTSLYQIGFSAADMQRFSLGDRMFQIQQSVVPPQPVTELAPPTTKENEGKGLEGKAPPPTPPPSPINRWGVWASGWGDFANVDSTNAAQGYRFTIGGISAGVDYLVIPNHFAVGLFGGYSRSWINLTPSGSASANTGRGGLYATYFNQGWWVDAAGWAGGTNYSTSRQAIAGTANGETSGWEASTFGEAGKDFLCGNFSFGPTVAMQYTNVHLNGFGENGSLIPLNIHGDSQDSLVTDVGARAYYTWQGAKTTIIPQVKLAWEHEYLYSNLPLTISAPALGATTTVYGPNVGHDSMLIDASLSIHPTSQIWLTIGYDGQVLRDHYLSNSVIGTLSFSF